MSQGFGSTDPFPSMYIKQRRKTGDVRMTGEKKLRMYRVLRMYGGRTYRGCTGNTRMYVCTGGVRMTGEDRGCTYGKGEEEVPLLTVSFWMVSLCTADQCLGTVDEM